MLGKVYHFLFGGSQEPDDATLVPLGDGYVRVESASYTVEVPEGWTVSEETPWGERTAEPTGEGQLGVMTVPPTGKNWDEVYQTSLHFIQREEPEGRPTPYRLVQRGDTESAEFEVKDQRGFAFWRFLLLRHPQKGILALSVKIPDRTEEREWEEAFNRMARTARFRPQGQAIPT